MRATEVRLTGAERRQLDRLEARSRRSRTKASRQALADELRALKMRIGLDKYARQEVTFAFAAQFAGVSFAQVENAAAARGIPYFRYSVAELEGDAQRATRWLRSRRLEKSGGPSRARV